MSSAGGRREKGRALPLEQSETPAPPPSGNPAGDAVRRSRRLLDWAYRGADALLDHGQARAFRFLWFFLPEPAVASDHRFQALLVSRFLSDAGQQALAYGALIAVVRGGGTAFDAALLGVAALIPPALLGLYGGAVADAIPRRIALAGIYNLQALLCFAAPGLIGTDLTAMMFLLFAVNSLGQVSGPSESSVIPLVASETQLATAAALISFASSLGAAFGTALLAPVLVKAFGVDTVIYVAGVLLLLAASRVFDLPAHASEPQARLRLSLLMRRTGARATIGWLIEQPAVATMVFVAAVAGTAQIVLQTLAPRYVHAVLGVDAANAVYVFALSAVGLGLALLLTPRLVPAIGERSTALIGFVLIGATLILLGLVDHLTFIDAVNPLHALGLAGLQLTASLRTAALLALPLGLGVALTTTSVQTYINRRVPLTHQGRTFALQSTLKNGAAIFPLTTLAAAAGVFGVETVLVASPFLLLGLAVGLIQLSNHFGSESPRGRIEVLASFWEEPAPGGGAR
jgi:MFS family permease